LKNPKCHKQKPIKSTGLIFSNPVVFAKQTVIIHLDNLIGEQRCVVIIKYYYYHSSVLRKAVVEASRKQEG